MNEFSVRLKGWSMSPLIREGDQLFLTSKFRLKNSDIILFKDQSGEYLAHRIIDLEKSLSKGDFSTCTDNFNKLEVLGVVKSILRNGRMLNLDIPFLNKTLFYLSRQRLRNRFLSRLSLLTMILFVKIFEKFYSKTKIHHI